jgi:uncharacterized membrane protein
MPQEHDTADAAATEISPFPSLRRVDASHPFLWLSRAVTDIRSFPLPSLFYGACFAAMGLLLTTVFRHAYAYASALMSGFLLLGPVLAMGLYEISRRREQGKACSLLPTLVVWKRNVGNIGIFAVVLGILFLVWARASLVIFALFYTAELPTLSAFLTQVVSLDNIEFLLVYFGIGLVFATLAFALSVVSIPLMLDRNQDAVTAMIASIGALLKNPGTMLVWALIIVVMTIIGFMTLYLGLIVLVPLIGHATWHAYRDMIEPVAA